MKIGTVCESGVGPRGAAWIQPAGADAALPGDRFEFKSVNSVLKRMEFALKTMNVTLNILNMINVLLKMMILMGTTRWMA